MGAVALSEGYPSGQLLRPTWKSFIPRPFISTPAACQGCPLSPRLPVLSHSGPFQGSCPFAVPLLFDFSESALTVFDVPCGVLGGEGVTPREPGRTPPITTSSP